MGRYDFGDIIVFCMGGIFLLMLMFLLLVGVPIGIYDSFYVSPAASEKANIICQEKGFDFYESYSRIGVLSKEPVAVKCKYVEQYRKVDLNIESEKE